METATITSKSQITLPKAVRETLGASAGDRIHFVPARHGYRLVVIKTELKHLAGLLKGRRRGPLSIDAMNNCIAKMGTEPEPAD